MKTIIAGSRSVTDPEDVREACFNAIDAGILPTEVVSGGARGADQLGEDWARDHGVPVKRFIADWDKYGKAAGPIRNEQMAAYAEALILVWDGKSRGSANMLETAKRKGLKISVYEV